MKAIQIIIGAGIAAALAACMGVAAMAYNATAEQSHARSVSESQQDKLDALVEQL